MPPRDRRAGRTSSGGPDEAAVTDELYATPPARFVALREERAAAAKAAGRNDVARRLHALHRPTLSAWAGNLLVRRQPDEVRRFLELGEALRRAHRELDGAQLRELSAQQWRVISALSEQAARLALDAGHRISEAAQREVENTLRAVMADADAADRWASGRLDGPLTPPTELAPASPDAPPAASRPAYGRSTAPSPGPTTGPTTGKREAGGGRPDHEPDHKDELAERRRRRQRELAQAREAAKEARRELAGRKKERDAARAAERRARSGSERALRRADTLERQLREARDEADRAAGEEREAASLHRDADDAVARAEQAADDADRKAERLGRRTEA